MCVCRGELVYVHLRLCLAVCVCVLRVCVCVCVQVLVSRNQISVLCRCCLSIRMGWDVGIIFSHMVPPPLGIVVLREPGLL